MSTTTDTIALPTDGDYVSVYSPTPGTGASVTLWWVADSNATGTVMVPVDDSLDVIGGSVFVRDLPDFLGDDWLVVE